MRCALLTDCYGIKPWWVLSAALTMTACAPAQCPERLAVARLPRDFPQDNARVDSDYKYLPRECWPLDGEPERGDGSLDAPYAPFSSFLIVNDYAMQRCGGRERFDFEVTDSRQPLLGRVTCKRAPQAQPDVFYVDISQIAAQGEDPCPPM